LRAWVGHTLTHWIHNSPFSCAAFHSELTLAVALTELSDTGGYLKPKNTIQYLFGVARNGVPTFWSPASKWAKSRHCGGQTFTHALHRIQLTRKSLSTNTPGGRTSRELGKACNTPDSPETTANVAIKPMKRLLEKVHLFKNYNCLHANICPSREPYHYLDAQNNLCDFMVRVIYCLKSQRHSTEMRWQSAQSHSHFSQNAPLRKRCVEHQCKCDYAYDGDDETNPMTWPGWKWKQGQLSQRWVRGFQPHFTGIKALQLGTE